MLEKIKRDATAAVQELLAVSRLKAGDLLVIGCSSSEMVGDKIGTNSSMDAAAALAEAGNSEAAIELITSYACNNAQDWYDSWLEMGDELYAKYMFDRVDMNEAKYPQWWSDVLDAAPDKPVEAPAE